MAVFMCVIVYAFCSSKHVMYFIARALWSRLTLIARRSRNVNAIQIMKRQFGLSRGLWGSLARQNAPFASPIGRDKTAEFRRIASGVDWVVDDNRRQSVEIYRSLNNKYSYSFIFTAFGYQIHSAFGRLFIYLFIGSHKRTTVPGPEISLTGTHY